jgi:hypothetical protein
MPQCSHTDPTSPRDGQDRHGLHNCPSRSPGLSESRTIRVPDYPSPRLSESRAIRGPSSPRPSSQTIRVPDSLYPSRRLVGHPSPGPPRPRLSVSESRAPQPDPHNALLQCPLFGVAGPCVSGPCVEAGLRPRCSDCSRTQYPSPGPRSLTHAMRSYNVLPVHYAPRQTVSVSKWLYSFITKRDTAVTVSVSNPITVSVSNPIIVSVSDPITVSVSNPITASVSNPITASVSDPALAAPVARPHALVAPSFIA